MDQAKSILKIYVFRLLSMTVGFASMIVVVPYLASDPEQYAIFAVISSLCLFLSYGDLGFLSASQKFCTEAVAKGSVSDESSYIGFTIKLLFSVFTVFAVAMLFFAANPEMLIKDMSDKNIDFASNMLTVAAFLVPIQIILQRFVYLVLSSRLKDYLFTRVDTVFGVVKISLVPLFVIEDGFLLFEYFTAITLISCFSGVIGLIIVDKHVDFSFKQIGLNLRLNRDVFHKMKFLAGSTMVSSVGFILYYEIDLIIAAQYFSVEEIAYLALAITFMNFIRALWVLAFAPFLVLMNTKYGLGDLNGVIKLASKICIFTMPIFILGPLILSKHIDQVVLYWVGNDYQLSAEIINIFLGGSIMVGFLNVLSHYLTTLKRYQLIVIFGVSPIVIYIALFLGLVNFFPSNNVMNLAYAKSASLLILSMAALYVLFRANVVGFWLLRQLALFFALGFAGFIFMPSFLDIGVFGSEVNPLMLIALLACLTLTTGAFSLFSLWIFRYSRSLLGEILRTFRAKTNAI